MDNITLDNGYKLTRSGEFQVKGLESTLKKIAGKDKTITADELQQASFSTDNKTSFFVKMLTTQMAGHSFEINETSVSELEDKMENAWKDEQSKATTSTEPTKPTPKIPTNSTPSSKTEPNKSAPPAATSQNDEPWVAKAWKSIFGTGKDDGIISKLNNSNLAGSFVATVATPVLFTGLAIAGTVTRFPSAIRALFNEGPLSSIKKWTGMDDPSLKDTAYPMLSGAVIGATLGVAGGGIGLAVGFIFGLASIGLWQKYRDDE
ncbi:MAG: hypothetical protein WCH76_05045 [Candidatus Riflemargulisbacteria bacterium]